MEAVLMKRIRLRGSWILYKIYNIYFAPNCPGRIVAPNCPRRIVPRRIVRAELSSAELSGHPQRDMYIVQQCTCRLVKIKVFKLRRDTDDIPCSITLRSAGGVSFQSEGPTTAKTRFWDREVRNHGRPIKRSQRSAERRGREERADSGLDMSSQRYFRARPCWDLATRSRTLYLTRAKTGSQCSSLVM